MTALPIHPLAKLLPPMSDGEYASLKDDIERNGVREKIVLLEGKILDGRHRARALVELGQNWSAKAVDYKDAWGDPAWYVYSKATHRHLTPSQKAAAAVAIQDALTPGGRKRAVSNLRQHTGADAGDSTGKSSAAAAATFGVSQSYVEQAKWLRQQDRKAFARVFAGEVKLSVARREVQRAHKRQALKSRRLTALPTAGSYHLAHGDCLELLPTLPRNKVRLVIADPPYNIGVDYGKGPQADTLDVGIYRGWCCDWIAECEGLLAPGGSLWIVIPDEQAAHLVLGAEEVGLTLRRWVIWYETFGANCSDNFNRTKRHLLYFVKGDQPAVFNHEAFNRPSARQVLYNDGRAAPGGKLWDDVWAIPRLVSAAERLPDFPTQLPLALIRPIVAGCSEPGDLVVDPFNGSGTTAHAAVEQGRHFWGCDLSSKFLGLARQRLSGVGREAKSLDQLLQAQAGKGAA